MRDAQQAVICFRFRHFPLAYPQRKKAALMVVIMRSKRRALAFIFVSNNFTLSDTKKAFAEF